MGSVLSRNLVRLLAGLVSDQVMKCGTKDPKIWKMQYSSNVCLQVQQGLWEMLEARLGEEEKFLMPGLVEMLLFQV